MRPPQVTIGWIMALVAVLAIWFSLTVQFDVIVSVFSTLIMVATITLPQARRSPIALIAWFSGALAVPFVCTALTFEVLWGYHLGKEWPILSASLP